VGEWYLLQPSVADLFAREGHSTGLNVKVWQFRDQSHQRKVWLSMAQKGSVFRATRLERMRKACRHQ
jgi:hypothetical protein